MLHGLLFTFFFAFTTGAAFSAFQENSSGSLDVGKRADFTLLPRDPFAVSPDELRVLEVEATYVGGERVYVRAGTPGA